MAKLASHMSPLLTDEIIEAFAEKKILTVVDVLAETPVKLQVISGLQYKDVSLLRDSLTSRCCPFPRNGLELFNDVMANSAIVPSGIEVLDDLLGGGFPTGSIFEICGQSLAGKTELCYTIAINASKNLKQNVFWIDAKSDCCCRRIHEILELKNCDDVEIGTVMEAIKVVNINSYYEMYSTLHYFQDNFSSLFSSIRIIIIDAVPAIFYNFMGPEKIDSIGLMNDFVTKMRYIANEFHCIFLLTNMTYTKFNEELDMACEDESSAATSQVNVALGKYWLHVPNTRLHLEKLEDETRSVTVMKSTYLPYKKSCIVHPMDMGFVCNK